MAIFTAVLLVGLLTFCPKAFVSGLSKNESFAKGSVPEWMLFGEKDIQFILSRRFRLYVLIVGVSLFVVEHLYR
jgi:hypothetical protein